MGIFTWVLLAVVILLILGIGSAAGVWQTLTKGWNTGSNLVHQGKEKLDQLNKTNTDVHKLTNT